MKPVLPLFEIRRRLAAVPPILGETPPRAAVAAILRDAASGPEILFIKRAEHPRDPWSGHMAFPGGRRDPGDADLQHTARRETREEIGLDLDAHGEPLGPLEDVPTHRTGLIVRPFVWTLESQAPALAPNHEVDEVLWTPLAALMSGEHDTDYDFEYGNQRHRMPAYKIGDRIVWGLTYRMLQILFARLRSG